jgi:hypothetical protein
LEARFESVVVGWEGEEVGDGNFAFAGGAANRDEGVDGL